MTVRGALVIAALAFVAGVVVGVIGRAIGFL